MPYCDDCSQFHAPTAMGAGGECPTCQRVIAPPPKAPWHFKLLMVAVVLYLGLRAVQGIAWVVGRI